MVPKLNIRNKLALILWGFTLAAFALVGMGLAVFQNLTVERRARQVMEPYARFVSVGTDAAVAFEDPVRAEEILGALQANPHITDAAIVLEDGRILAGFGNQSEGAHLDKPDGIHLLGGTIELLEPLPHGARLRLAMKLEQLGEETTRILWLFGAGALVLLAITLGQLVVLQRTITAPVTTLAAAVDRVRTRADYDQHVPAAGDDEVARLGRNFNAMMETIRVRDRDLRQLALFQHALVDSAAYGIISYDPDGTVTSFNRAAERLLGYRADEVVDIRSPNLWHDPKEVTQRAHQLSVELGEPIAPGFEVFSARASRGIPDEGEWTFIRKDGIRVPVLLSITALKDRTGKLAGYVGLVNDLTERKRAEEEIRKLNQELEQRVTDRTAQLETANQDLEAFAYSVSHDLRSPLRHIDGFLGMIRRRAGTALDEQSLRYMDTISESVDKMDLLIESLLSFSRLGRKAVSFQEVALETLVRDVIRDLEHETAGRSVEWRIGELPVVRGDAAILRIVLVNLVSNALKFSRSRPNARIEIGLQPGEDSEVVIFVRDNGVGFDMAYEDKLFGVFQRLHGEEEFEGTGIGLANAQRVIKRHGGRIWAEGKIDQGATFYFSLPRSAQT